MRRLLGIVLAVIAALLAALAGFGIAALVTHTYGLVETPVIITVISAVGSWALFRIARSQWSGAGPASRAPVIALTLLLLLTATLVLAMYQFRIRAFVWHMRHGDFVQVAGYRVPVPRYWWVEKRSGNDAHLWNTKTGESIWFHSLPKSPTFTVEGWDKVLEHRTNNAENAITGKRDISVAGERFICLENDYTVSVPQKLAARSGEKELHLPSIDCMSGEPFEIMFFGGMRTATRYDFAEFYSLIAALQRTT